MKNIKYLTFIFVIICLFGCADKNIEEQKLDTEDLICVRNSDYIDFQYKETITISFDDNSIITEYEEKNVIVYPTNIEATNYYNEVKSNNPGMNIYLENNQVMISKLFSIDKNNNYFGKTKEEMKKIYIEELFYDCE